MRAIASKDMSLFPKNMLTVYFGSWLPLILFLKFEIHSVKEEEDRPFKISRKCVYMIEFMCCL